MDVNTGGGGGGNICIWKFISSKCNINCVCVCCVRECFLFLYLYHIAIAQRVQQPGPNKLLGAFVCERAVADNCQTYIRLYNCSLKFIAISQCAITHSFTIIFFLCLDMCYLFACARHENVTHDACGKKKYKGNI